jgi:site-specific recombinase XerD
MFPKHNSVDKWKILSFLQGTNLLMAQILYGCGLRLMECVRLRIKDIDFGINKIYILAAKGGKNRIVQFPKAIVTDMHSQVDKAIKTASKKALINKHVTSHTFRHSFATHLLEDGVNIRVVQDLMGHADVKTTEIYTHVMNKDLNAVMSPLDTLHNIDKA